LSDFTHGLVQQEDTTIARHAVAIGASLERRWLYRDIEVIRDIVNNRATTCRKTGRPLVYLSCDAHALRRYIDQDSFKAEWKMVNGLRAWCIDKDNGAIIHLGGEYTWGDCRQVAIILKAAIEAGYLPADGNYGGRRKALYVWVSDGMPWFGDHLWPLFHRSAMVIVLDAYHVLERLKGFTTKVHPNSKKLATKLYETLKPWITGQRDETTKSYPYPETEQADYVKAMLDTIRDIPLQRAARVACREKLLAYLNANAHRIDYAQYRARGFSIGSGPMESFHRTASQARLKLPGARWTTENSQSLLNLRLMRCVGRWDEFWTRRDINQNIREAFAA
jgi:hypothetical protein